MAIATMDTAGTLRQVWGEVGRHVRLRGDSGIWENVELGQIRGREREGVSRQIGRQVSRLVWHQIGRAVQDEV